ncbi:unnamed protein product [Coffea canephora]|uniref:Uncharacterized protein n=2 Tax=Coffea TaxID=13442 RepID=A0A068UV15_COFCA|nr:unnamed protein product [Coffea canephora]
MAPSFDCSMSSLLCAEDDSSVFGDDGDEVFDYGVVTEEFDDIWHQGKHQKNNQNMGFYGGKEILIGLPLPSEEFLALMIKKECEHLPATDYLKRLKNGDLDLGARQIAMDWVKKVHARFNFGPLSLYLALNYLDRFLSVHEQPEKPWAMHLLAIACLTLAAKMEETEVLLIQDILVGDSKSFKAKHVQRMELLVLGELKWRMQAVTPFSFLDYFLEKIGGGDQSSSSSSITRATQLILGTFKGIDFLEYRPSEIAAAVAISVAGAAQAVDVETAISALLIQHVQKDRVIKCVELLKEVSSLGDFPSASAPSVPQSPIGVLDAACFSCKTDDAAVGSCANSSHTSPVAKKRRLEDL